MGEGMLSGVYEVVAGHFGRLGYAHDVEDGRGYVGEDAVFNCGGLVVGYGTGLSEWAVLGVPSGLMALSALPWSAIMIAS